MKKTVRLGDNTYYFENVNTVNIETPKEKPPKFIGDIPSETEIFIGRDKDLVEIHKRLNKKNSLLLLVNGVGGIGKTTLASHYYHKYQNEYSHLIWTIANPDINDAFTRIALCLKIEFDPKLDIEERKIETIRKLLELDKPCLLVIDNANILDDIKSNYSLLRKCSNIHIILTTRISNYKKNNEHRISPLNKTAAFCLFNQYYSIKDSEEDLLKEILIAVDYNTLVIELLAKNLAELNSIKTIYTLADLKEDLLSNGILKLSKTTNVSTDYQDLYEAKPEEIVEAMYNISSLTMQEKKLLLIFSILPSKDIPYEHLEDLLPKFNSLTKTVDSLAQKGWLDKKEITINAQFQAFSFRISPVIQEIVKNNIYKNNFKIDLHELILTITDKLDHDPVTGSLTHLKYESVIHYSQYAEALLKYTFLDTNISINLLERLGGIFFIFGDIKKSLTYFKKYLTTSENLHNSNRSNLCVKHQFAIACERIGHMHSILGNSKQALKYLVRSNEISTQLLKQFPNNSTYKNEQAISYGKIGDIHLDLGNNSLARSYYEKDLRITEELYETCPENIHIKYGLSISYGKIGHISLVMDDIKSSEHYYTKSILIATKLYESCPENITYKFGLAIANNNMGKIYLNLDKFDKAILYFNKDIELTEELHKTSPHNLGFKQRLANTLHDLGNIYYTQENYDLSSSFLQRSISIAEKLHATSPKVIPFMKPLYKSYFLMGSINHEIGNTNRAIAFFKKNIKLLKQLNKTSPSDTKLKQALYISHERVSHIYMASTSHETTLGWFRKTLQIITELHISHPANLYYHSDVAAINGRIAEVFIATKEYKEALKFYKKNLSIMEKITKTDDTNISFRHGLAISYDKIGTVYENLKKYQLALDHYTKSIKLSHQLHNLSSNNEDHTHLLSITLTRIGNLLVQFNMFEISINYFQEAERILYELVDISPNNTEYQSLLETVIKYLDIIKPKKE